MPPAPAWMVKKQLRVVVAVEQGDEFDLGVLLFEVAQDRVGLGERVGVAGLGAELLQRADVVEPAQQRA